LAVKNIGGRTLFDLIDNPAKESNVVAAISGFPGEGKKYVRGSSKRSPAGRDMIKMP